MADLQVTLNQDPDYKKKISDTAKKTSARPEIQASRAQGLKEWRDNNREEFKEKCVKKMLAAKPDIKWFSKPEKMLFKFLSEIDGFNFRFNQVVISDKFDWKSKRKQVDIADKSNNIYVEFDGPFHFKLWNNEAKLNETKRRDELLNKYIKDNNYLLIRISYDQFHDSRTNSYFKQECLDKILSILKQNKMGIYKIGLYYE